MTSLSRRNRRTTRWSTAASNGLAAVALALLVAPQLAAGAGPRQMHSDNWTRHRRLSADRQPQAETPTVGHVAAITSQKLEWRSPVQQRRSRAPSHAGATKATPVTHDPQTKRAVGASSRLSGGSDLPAETTAVGPAGETRLSVRVKPAPKTKKRLVARNAQATNIVRVVHEAEAAAVEPELLAQDTQIPDLFGEQPADAPAPPPADDLPLFQPIPGAEEPVEEPVMEEPAADQPESGAIAPPPSPEVQEPGASEFPDLVPPTAGDEGLEPPPTVPGREALPDYDAPPGRRPPPPGATAEQALPADLCANDRYGCRQAWELVADDTLRSIGPGIELVGSEGKDFPCICPLEEQDFAGRHWAPTTYLWKASALCHKPLYFEQVGVERYGHTVPCQGVVSAAHFFATVPLLPYHMGMNPPWECIYSLGYYRPGNCAPYMIPPFPVSLRGAAVQAGITTGLIYAIP